MIGRRGFLLGAGASALLAGCTTPRAAQLPPPEGRFVTVAGRRVHVIEKGRGPALVMIHGASGNARGFSFRLMDMAAARGYRAIAVDRPGFGHSDPPVGEPGDLVVQARILQAAMARLGAARPLLLGHSYGGAVALAWAVTMPRAAAAVIPVSAVTHPWAGPISLGYGFASTQLGATLAVALASDAWVRRALRLVFAPQPVPPGYAEHIGVGFALRPETFRINARQIDTLRQQLAPIAARYPGLRLPIEAVHGLADHVVPARLHAERLARELPRRVRYTPLPGIGHMPHQVMPEAVLAAVDRAARRAGLR